ncbi:hypothetical protein GCM10023085_07550 [Actinomadura viridis]|uniref:Uncharacterized protein n=1 Tax=Actinomadura viridis TaxID=58110 RepID=A0A931DN93_9ACTN|nr:hypothetical protein [Actinomadura viridis]MBG6091764.1 hypothetical protein [Actinomadura viridis]
MTGDAVRRELIEQDPLGQVRLPLTGWVARLYQHDGRPVRMVLNPGGGSLLSYELPPAAASDQLVLGAHHVGLPRAYGPAAVATLTLAYGVMSGEPPEVAFRQHRLWRPARTRQVRPLILADRIWLAEQAGHFDEVRTTAAGHTAVRLL